MSRRRSLVDSAVVDRRSSTERGASVVEFAIVLPLLLLLLFGIVDMGFTLDDTIRLRGAVRESGRLVATDDYDRAVTLKPECLASGVSGGTDRAKWAGCRTLAMLTEAGFDQDKVGIEVRMLAPTDPSGFTVLADGSFYSTANEASKGAIMICVTTPANSRTGMLSGILKDKKLTSRIIMPFELPTGQKLEAPDDAIFSDFQTSVNPSWSFCDPSSAAR